MDEGVRREMLSFMPRLRRFSYGLTGSRDAGDDLMQATYERAIREIRRWQPGTRLDSWMYRIARNIHLNNLRAMRVRGEHLAPVELDHHADGERVADTQIAFGAVRDFMARLPEEQRSVLLLVCVEGLSYKEVSELLDLPLGTIASRLGRARMALTALMDGDATLQKAGQKAEREAAAGGR
jgi:RNA polymerase sigma-70 factor (ECF subfamily)